MRIITIGLILALLIVVALWWYYRPTFEWIGDDRSGPVPMLDTHQVVHNDSPPELVAISCGVRPQFSAAVYDLRFVAG